MIPHASWRASQQLPDLFVVGLVEALVPLSDRAEERRSLQADDLVRHGSNPFARFHRCDGDRHHDAFRAQAAQRTHGGFHRRAGGESVIHEDPGAPAHLQRRPVATVGFFAPGQFLQFARLDLLDRVAAARQVAHDVLVEHERAAAGDRAHRRVPAATACQACARPARRAAIRAPTPPQSPPARRRAAGQARPRSCRPDSG